MFDPAVGRDRKAIATGSTPPGNDQGISAVLVALSMMVLVGMAAVALDVGNVYQERRSAQNAADQAALTAAYSECSGLSQADSETAGVAAAARNGFDDSDPDVVVTVTRQADFEYMAEVTTEVESTFGKVLGASQLGTSGEAVASCNATAGGTGTTLHAHAPPSCPGDELSINADHVHVDGGTHSNGDISVSGDDVEMYDGTTYGGNWSASADDEDIDPEQTSGPDDAPYPIEYDINDYDQGGYFDNTLDASLYTYHSSSQTFTDSISAGVHFINGTVEIHGGDEDDPFHVDSVDGYDGVVIVATGPIELYSDWLELSYFEHASNAGLLLFSNYGSTSGDPCFDGAAIDTRSDHPSYEGVLFAPYGRANVLSDGASAAAVWANYVNLTGNQDDDGIHLSYPGGAVTAPEYQMQFEQ